VLDFCQNPRDGPEDGKPEAHVKEGDGRGEKRGDVAAGICGPLPDGFPGLRGEFFGGKFAVVIEVESPHGGCEFMVDHPDGADIKARPGDEHGEGKRERVDIEVLAEKPGQRRQGEPKEHDGGGQHGRQSARRS